jgi:hypothetical protein
VQQQQLQLQQHPSGAAPSAGASALWTFGMLDLICGVNGVQAVCPMFVCDQRQYALGPGRFDVQLAHQQQVLHVVCQLCIAAAALLWGCAVPQVQWPAQERLCLHVLLRRKACREQLLVKLAKTAAMCRASAQHVCQRVTAAHRHALKRHTPNGLHTYG